MACYIQPYQNQRNLPTPLTLPRSRTANASFFGFHSNTACFSSTVRDCRPTENNSEPSCTSLRFCSSLASSLYLPPPPLFPPPPSSIPPPTPSPHLLLHLPAAARHSHCSYPPTAPLAAAPTASSPSQAHGSPEAARYSSDHTLLRTIIYYV